jgi:hypothetical protein
MISREMLGCLQENREIEDEDFFIVSLEQD